GTEVVEDPNGKTFTVTSRVEFRVTKEDNEVEVTCTVDHESLQNSERSTTQKLQVHCRCWGRFRAGVEVQGTPPRWLGVFRDMKTPRSDFVLSPQEFLWEKEGSDAPLQLSSDSVLIFPFLNKSDSGTYVCTATSSMGSVVAKYNLDDGISPLLPPFSLPAPTVAQDGAPGEEQQLLLPCRVSTPFCLFFSSPPAWADASPVPSTSSTYHAMIGGVVAVIVFLLLSLLIVLGHYLIRHKGT
ncbi:CADM3 protein, partial [Prunella fulvescens]|nr:CADM3 protein [Prunella fulvescens]